MWRRIALLAVWLFGVPAMAAEEPNLSVRMIDDDRGEVRLCFPAVKDDMRYELVVSSKGASGNVSTSRQRGNVEFDRASCPVVSRISLPPGTTLEARLLWWLGEEEQPEVVRTLER